jgi:ATP-binding cassette subfamily B protein
LIIPHPAGTTCGMLHTGLGTKALGKDAYDAPILIKRLFMEQALQHWRMYAFAVPLMALSAGATALPAYLFGQVINQAYENRNMPAIYAIGLAIFVLFVIKGLATYGHQVMMTRIGVRIVVENQRRMYAKLLNEGLAYFSAHHSSEFIARMTAGANSSAQVINIIVTAVGRDLLTLIGLLAVMLVQDPILTLGSFVIVPPILIFMRKLIKRLRNVATQQYNLYAEIIEAMQETVQGIAVVKAFTLENHLRARLDKTLDDYQHEAFKQARIANRSGPLMDTLGGVAIAAGIVYCGYRVVVGGDSPGAFFSFMSAFLLAYEPAKRLARLNLDIISNLVGVRVLLEIIDGEPGEPVEDGKPPLALTTARIEFENVNFSYRIDEPVLRNMSFVAAPSKVTALVGPSGGGKSTVLNLLLRFYDPVSGTVSIDGQDITSVSRSSLRHQIGYVGQNVQLFHGTIRENIAFGKLGVSDDEIIAAAKAAHAHDFIMSFPLGYDAAVGEHGLQLSGGQRQRVAIARALVRNAPIILLDEATAALDSESERYVQDAITELCRGRTTLVIAHRLSTIMHADTILVIEAGRVVESGRHEELLRSGGRYASFYRLQLQDHSGSFAVSAAE